MGHIAASSSNIKVQERFGAFFFSQWGCWSDEREKKRKKKQREDFSCRDSFTPAGSGNQVRISSSQEQRPITELHDMQEIFKHEEQKLEPSLAAGAEREGGGGGPCTPRCTSAGRLQVVAEALVDAVNSCKVTQQRTNLSHVMQLPVSWLQYTKMEKFQQCLKRK